MNNSNDDDDDTSTNEASPSPPSLPVLEQQVQHAMMQLDRNLTKEYYRALEVIPTLVQHETRIVDFLRVEDNHMERTATRLARYWKTRKALFGERWLLPMTQTGTGAMEPHDIATLRSGFLQLVHSTVHGQVLIVDFTLLPSTQHSHRQMTFYIATICPHPVTWLFIVKSGQRPPVIMDAQMRELILLSTAIAPKQIFIAQTYEPGREHLLDFLSHQQRVVTKANYQVQCNEQLKGNSARETLRILESKGFDKHCLPQELGGYLTKSTFDDWIRMRLSLEDAMAAAPIGRNHTRSPHQVPIQGRNGARNMMMMIPHTAAMAASNPAAVAVAAFSDPNSAAAAAATAITTTVMVKANHPSRRRSSRPVKGTQRTKENVFIERRPNETEADFIKRKNALYVRRSYHRQKIEMLKTQAEAAKCQTQNDYLKAENKRLQGLLHQALYLIQTMEGSASFCQNYSTNTTTTINNSGTAALKSDDSLALPVEDGNGMQHPLVPSFMFGNNELERSE